MVTIKFTISAILTILAGLLVLFWPKLIRVVLGLYLLIVGTLNLFNLDF